MLGGMPITRVLANNLAALMNYAAESESVEAGPASQKALAGLTGLGRGTIQRALGRSKDLTAVGIDTLEALARAYGLQAWELLLPGLDPRNPPIVITPAAQLLSARFKTVPANQARPQQHDRAHEAKRRPGKKLQRTRP